MSFQGRAPGRELRETLARPDLMVFTVVAGPTADTTRFTVFGVLCRLVNAVLMPGVITAISTLGARYEEPRKERHARSLGR